MTTSGTAEVRPLASTERTNTPPGVYFYTYMYMCCEIIVFYITFHFVFFFSAIITNINHNEVWFKRLDGSKSKLYISQLQKGKYTIKHS